MAAKGSAAADFGSATVVLAQAGLAPRNSNPSCNIRRCCTERTCPPGLPRLKPKHSTGLCTPCREGCAAVRPHLAVRAVLHRAVHAGSLLQAAHQRGLNKVHSKGGQTWCVAGHDCRRNTAGPAPSRQSSREGEPTDAHPANTSYALQGNLVCRCCSCSVLGRRNAAQQRKGMKSSAATPADPVR